MSYTTDPTGERPAAQVPMVPVAPHPPLRRYYGEDEERQAFLNELFNRTAYQYRNIDKATGFGSGLWYRRKALREAGLKAGMHVLDVACGPALVAQCARDVVGPSGRVIGLDPSIGMLREAQKGPCRNLVRGIGEQLPFPDQEFRLPEYGLRNAPRLRPEGGILRVSARVEARRDCPVVRHLSAAVAATDVPLTLLHQDGVGHRFRGLNRKS